MQGLADGYFITPSVVSNYLAQHKPDPISNDHPDVQAARKTVEKRIERLLNAPNAKTPPDVFHRKLGKIIWEHCGMSRSPEGLKQALEEIPKLRKRFWDEVKVTGSGEEFNQTLERAGRVADFLELGELMCHDALERNESCGSHARVDHLTSEGEVKRDDENYSYISAWQWGGDPSEPILQKEQLRFEFVKPSIRSYK
jgi:succinate dehydrogenase / fumarate reductase flavoprotein subunit